MDRKEGSETGEKKPCSLLWGQCTQSMKNELQAVADCDQMKRHENPMQPIKNIKGVTHDFRAQRHTTGSVWCAHKQLHNCIQKDDEDIKKCHDRFKNQVEVIENCGGELGTKAKLFEQDEMCKDLNEREKAQEEKKEKTETQRT